VGIAASPIGEVYWLENPGKISLELIEVQTGSYFGGDDIIRIEEGVTLRLFAIAAHASLVAISSISAQRHTPVRVGHSPLCRSQRSCTNLRGLFFQSPLLLGKQPCVELGHLPVSFKK
jgi:hypothetical protein